MHVPSHGQDQHAAELTPGIIIISPLLIYISLDFVDLEHLPRIIQMSGGLSGQVDHQRLHRHTLPISGVPRLSYRGKGWLNFNTNPILWGFKASSTSSKHNLAFCLGNLYKILEHRSPILRDDEVKIVEWIRVGAGSGELNQSFGMAGVNAPDLIRGFSSSEVPPRLLLRVSCLFKF